MAEREEHTDNKLSLPSQGQFFVHHAEAVCQSREPYGPSGFGGLFSNYYATSCAAFAALGGLIFGYDQVRFHVQMRGADLSEISMRI